MVEIDHDLCDGCGTCVGVCPVDALMMARELRADHDLCIGCGNCVRVCPFGALTVTVHHENRRRSTEKGTV